MTETKRHWLLKEALCGRLTPDEAEAQAQKAGIELLETHPDPALFDPIQEPFWTFTMAVAWIAWRTENAVREAWGKYRDEDWFFVKIHSGWELKRHGPSISRLYLLEALNDADDGDGPLFLPVMNAEAALWRGLSEGALTASAVHDQFSQRTEIPAINWQDLKLANANGDEVLTGVAGAAAAHVHYLKPALASAQIMAKWPQSNAVTPGPVNASSLTTTAELEAAYIKRRDEWPSDKPTPSERDDWGYMKKLKSDITRERVRELRKKLAPDAWKQVGRRKSRGNPRG